MSGDRTPDIREQFQGLAALLPQMEKPDCRLGDWRVPADPEDGVITLPMFEFSPIAEAFIDAAYRCIQASDAFDWGAWSQTPEAVQLRDDPDAMAVATPRQIVSLLTILVRQERFCEGALAAAFESGFLTRIVRRASQLAAEMNGDEE